jgi:prepilin-type N-terminal cleavage/methylation domain-containing protein
MRAMEADATLAPAKSLGSQDLAGERSGTVQAKRVEAGFTLVELMVVVLIIGILISIAIPVFLGATDNAYSRSCQATQRIITGSVAMAISLNEDTSTVGAANAVLDVGSGWGKVLIPGYIMSTPRCPSPKGGLYNMNPAGDVLSDKGAGQLVFVGEGTGFSHRLSQ